MMGSQFSLPARLATGLSTGAMAALSYLLLFQRTGTSNLVWITLVVLWLGPAGVTAFSGRNRRRW